MNLKRYTIKANHKTTCFLFIIHRLILNFIMTENATQYAYKSALSFVDLEASLVQKDSVETKSLALLGSLLGFDFCFTISETN